MRISTKDPAEMTAGAINKELDRLDKLSSQCCQEMIDSGRGYETLQETFTKSDPLSLRYRQVSERQGSLRWEIRLRYGPNSPSRLPTDRRCYGPRVKQEKVA